MSVRIYQLSKEIGMDNNSLIELLKERGFQVKSASSTVDNISADSIKSEFAKKETVGASDASTSDAEENAPEKPVEAPSASRFVRSVEQIETEKKEAEEAKQAASAPAPQPVPAAPKPPAPAAPPVASAPAPMAPPKTSPPPASPPPIRKVAASSPAPVSAPPSVSKIPAPGGAPPSPAAPAPATPPSPGAPSPISMAPPAASQARAQSDEIRSITLKPPIVVRDFANELGLKPFKLISELMEMGIFASINQSLDEEVAAKVAEKHGVLLEIRHRGEGAQPKKKVEKKVDESKLLEERPPVVCILGHVDHGKTSLLDNIRKANVVSGEAGGITQHIGAYQVDHVGKKITFLDTPGHAAFNAMRSRGANLTDVAILIVAADDGFMPQTDEALKYLKRAGVSPIVAINKIDARGANIERVKQQMQERGISSEDWGGETIATPISALKGEGIEELLDMILLQTEMLELKANPKKPAEGIVIEAQMEVGRGATATILVEAGTLKIGDALVCGHCYTKVKAMLNEYGKNVKVAPPSSAVRVIGWSETPECGVNFHSVKNEKAAKREAEEAKIVMKRESQVTADENVPSSQEELLAAITATHKKALRVILKGDVFGSVEAVVSSLKEIESEKVKLDIISAGVGAVSKSDIQKASAGGAIIIGFNVKNENGAVALAKHHDVKIEHYQIIYELIDAVREDMVEMLDAEYRENKIGAAEIRQVFPISKGFVAGCLVVEGRVQSGANARVLRRDREVFSNKIESVRREKDEVKEVRAGTECGIQIRGYNDYKEGDVIEVFEVHEVRASL